MSRNSEAAPDNGLLLSLRKATFRLGDKLVFPNSNWQWRIGENWAVTGVNGSGKSLFSEALRGLMPLVSGERLLHFPLPHALQSAEDAIGHVSIQDRRDCFHEQVLQSRWQSGEENLTLLVKDFLTYERVLGLNPFDVTPRPLPSRKQFARKISGAIRFFKIQHLLERHLLALSNGELQKVLITRALSLPVRLLFLDDPFAGLDISSRRHFIKLLGQLPERSADPLNLLILTNRPDELPESITHVLEVNNSRIIWAGSRREWQSIGKKPERKGRRQAAQGIVLKPIRSKDSYSRKKKQPIIRLQNVSVRYGKVLALDSVTWEVCAHQSWALLGPNGSGKTTLLSLITADHPQAWGNEIEILGHRLEPGESVWAVKKQLGFVSPELHLLFDPSTTCLETVASGLFDMMGVFQKLSHSQRRKAQMALRDLKLVKDWRKLQALPLSELSHGFQRMIFLARALVKRPPLLILDEPCQGLDAEHRNRFNQQIDQLLARRLAAVIYVSHHMDELPKNIKQVLHLDRGKIISVGER